MTRPAMFAGCDFAAARELARRECKLLLVDATAPWCGPCQQMDRTTWRDARVVAWLEAYAIAIQINVDFEPGLARQLGVTAMPTMIVFSPEGEELDRVRGARKAEAMLEWLERVKHGGTELDKLMAEVAKHPDDVGPRVQLAEELVNTGRDDEALEQYLELCERSPVIPFIFLRSLARLVSRHPPTRVALVALRERLAPPNERAPDQHAFVGWCALNRILGEPEETLRWYDDVPARIREAADFKDAVRSAIGPLLLGGWRFHDAWQLYGSELLDRPVRDLVAQVRLFNHVPSSSRRNSRLK